MPRVSSREREPLSSSERDQQAQITPDDKQRAAEEWRRAVRPAYRDLLDAK